MAQNPKLVVLLDGGETALAWRPDRGDRMEILMQPYYQRGGLYGPFKPYGDAEAPEVAMFIPWHRVHCVMPTSDYDKMAAHRVKK